MNRKKKYETDLKIKRPHKLDYLEKRNNNNNNKLMYINHSEFQLN